MLQLEEELSLRRGEIQELQQCLLHSGPPPADHPEAAETLRLRERLLSASQEHQRESGLLRDKYEKALRAYQAEVEKLRAANEKYAQEVVDLKAKVQQATSENMGLMDNWKSKLDSLALDHQKSLEDLKATLNSSPGAQQKEIGELKAVMEGIKMEHQLELGNLRAKHDIETAMHVKEKEGLRQKLQEAQEELAGLQQHWRAQLEVQASQHRLELQEAQDRCRDAELRGRELEKLDVEYRGQAQAIAFLKEQISLAEKKMLDYELLQRSEAQSKQEADRLREKLLVTENRLQAVESLCSTQHTNVGGHPSCLAVRGPRTAAVRARGPGWGGSRRLLTVYFQSREASLLPPGARRGRSEGTWLRGGGPSIRRAAGPGDCGAPRPSELTWLGPHRPGLERCVSRHREQPSSQSPDTSSCAGSWASPRHQYQMLWHWAGRHVEGKPCPSPRRAPTWGTRGRPPTCWS